MNAKSIKPLLYMLTAATLFCFTEITLKLLNGSINCLELNFSRYALDGLLLLPIALPELHRRGARLSRRHFLWFQLLGFVGITLVGPFYQLAASLLQANITSVLFSLNPLFIALLAMPMLGEPLSRYQVLGLAVGAAAIWVLVDPLNMTLSPAGLILLLLTVLCYSFYAVAGKRLITELGSAAVTAGSFLCGGLQLFLLALMTHLPPVAAQLEAHGLGSLAYASLFGGYTLDNLVWVVLLYFGVTLGAYLCWFRAMESGSTFLGSLTYFVKPALSPVAAWFILGEPITTRILLGAALLLVSAGVSLTGKKSAEPEKALAS